MISTIIAYDNADFEIGDYFNRSYLHLEELKNQTTISITDILNAITYREIRLMIVIYHDKVLTE